MMWEIELASWNANKPAETTFVSDAFQTDDANLKGGETPLSVARKAVDLPFPHAAGTLEEVIDPATGAFALYYELDHPGGMWMAHVVRGRPVGAPGFPLTDGEWRQLYTESERHALRGRPEVVA